MLIRSQSKKTIINLENVIRISAEGTWNIDNEVGIYAYTNAANTEQGDNRIDLGYYSSMDRCIEILDEIQAAYKAMSLCDSATIRTYAIQGATVYQMPEE